jgi:dienelactone hydrolase
MTTTTNFRQRLLACLGGDWPESCPLEAHVERVEAGDGYRIEHVQYQVELGEMVPAVMLVPDGVDESRPAPGICVWHQHAGQWHLGKSEPAGLAGDPMHHTGVALAKEGYVVLCPDALGFEAREKGYQHTGGALERFLFLRYVVSGRSMAWKNILDMRRAVDYLASRPDVNADALGCYGHSMGSTHAWLVGPWEPRLRAIVGNCCMPSYAAIHDKQLLHCFPNFIPGLHNFGDVPDIAALIAPRPLHLNFGENDKGSPIEHVQTGLVRIAEAYTESGAAANFTSYIEPGAGHVLSQEMWLKSRDFFARHLVNRSHRAVP